MNRRRRVIRDLLRAGWRLIRHGKHTVLRYPGGGTIYVSTSPKDVDEMEHHVRQDAKRRKIR